MGRIQIPVPIDAQLGLLLWCDLVGLAQPWGHLGPWYL